MKRGFVVGLLVLSPKGQHRSKLRAPFLMFHAIKGIPVFDTKLVVGHLDSRIRRGVLHHDRSHSATGYRILWCSREMAVGKNSYWLQGANVLGGRV